ncbi:V-type proton ATPase subunit S1 [Wyeomyia smithii]|uniref:V-type proton ATPase subunit S1 n=1 Tax=Wyeomyia smithii TaxID=174621 RepID=UPI002467EA11|nr:V-type proton ATPase subunit S1 [Wyeomyia smithii]
MLCLVWCWLRLSHEIRILFVKISPNRYTESVQFRSNKLEFGWCSSRFTRYAQFYVMKSSRTFTVLLLSVAISSYALAENVPVFIWGKSSVSYVPALPQYATSEFAALVESQVNAETFTVVFVEEQLSTEDLTLCKLNTQTCFRNLAKEERKSYLPNVQEPLAAFENVQSVDMFEDGNLSEEIVPQGGAAVIVSLRGNDFASHDALISNLYNRLREKSKNILAIYTGKTTSFRYSTLIRRTRQVKQDTTEVTRTVLTAPNDFIIAYESFKAGSDEQTPTEVVLTSATKSNDNKTDENFQIDIAGPSGQLKLNFMLAQGSWEIVGVAYDNVPYYLRHRVHVNQHFSYHCNRLEYYTADHKSQIVFEEVQLQPFFEENVEKFDFGDSWDCVGFTSPGILTGLFLVAIFIIIGSYGITWMMDIRTMDRYDDPKGKTITVTAAE